MGIKAVNANGQSSSPAGQPVAAGGRKASTQRFERKQEELIVAATQILNQRGLKGFTLAEVAKKAGLITQGVAYYFPKKDDLASACILRTVSKLEQLLAGALTKKTAKDRVADFLLNYTQLVSDVNILGAAPLATFAEVRALSESNYEHGVSAVVQLFKRMREVFDTPELAWMDQHTRIARTALLLQLTLSLSSWIHSKEARDYTRNFERTLDILFNGMSTDPAMPWNPLPLPEFLPSTESPAREAFLIAATQLINEEGYRGASVEKISARLNVSKGAFYHHNEAKDDVVVRCFERTLGLLTQVQMTASALDGNEWQRLTSASAALGELQLSRYGPLLRDAALYALPPGAAPAITREWELVTNRFAGMISDGIAEGSIRPIDPLIGGNLIMVAINSAAELPAWLQSVRQSEIAQLYVRPALCGLLAP